MEGWAPVVAFAGFLSDETVIISDYQIRATFSQGVPSTLSAKPVSLSFQRDASGERRILEDAASDSTGKEIVVATTSESIELKKDFSLPSGSLLESSSFAGGRAVTIPAKGLSQTFMKDSENNYISVCGGKAEVDATNSDADNLVFFTPAAQTVYSARQFKIQEAHELRDAITVTGTVEDMSRLTDVHTNFNHEDASSQCEIRMTFEAGKVGILNIAKFFIHNFVDISPYVGLEFQGSDSGFDTYETLGTFGKTTHAGWNDFLFEENQPAFHEYRLLGSNKHACRFSEISLTGLVVNPDDNSVFDCKPVLYMEGSEIEITSPVRYQDELTPLLNTIEPRFGSVLGGEVITFNGSGFGFDTSAVSVTIDGITCEVEYVEDSLIECMTGSRPDTEDDPSLIIRIAGKGDVANQGHMFRYVKRWSDIETWGMDSPPLEGESVSIPKGMHLLMDVDSTPILNLIIVEGSLIFAPDADPEHQRSFDAYYVMVKGGYLEIGTEEFPYTSKLTITMHGDSDTPPLPVFGAKVIALHFGHLEMHGVKRNVCWTDLKETSEAGSS